MSSLLPLLLFCDFLENRLHTLNLSLLRRILSDFFAGSEQTLQDFIRLGASIVTVMPIERKSALRQREAARLVAQQQNIKEEDSKQLCVFSYLSARVANRNIFLLRSMFQDFCAGSDRLICEFVRRGDEVVSLIPADIQSLQVNQIPTGWTDSVLDLERNQEQNDQQQLESNANDSEDESSGADTEDEDEIGSVAELASVASMPPTRAEVHNCIMEVLDRIEKQ